LLVHPGREMAAARWTSQDATRYRALLSLCLLSSIVAIALISGPASALAAGGQALAGNAEAPVLSGYGGPGAGAQVIVASQLYNEEATREARRTPSAGARAGAPVGQGRSTGRTASKPGVAGAQGGEGRPPRASSSAAAVVGGSAAGSSGGNGPGNPGSGAAGGSGGGYPLSASAPAGRRAAAVAGLGLSGGDLLAASLILVALVTVSFLTRRLASDGQ
jgi:hypothetical protein